MYAPYCELQDISAWIVLAPIHTLSFESNPCLISIDQVGRPRIASAVVAPMVAAGDDQKAAEELRMANADPFSSKREASAALLEDRTDMKVCAMASIIAVTWEILRLNVPFRTFAETQQAIVWCAPRDPRTVQARGTGPIAPGGDEAQGGASTTC